MPEFVGRATAAARTALVCAIASLGTAAAADAFTVSFGEILSDFTGPVLIGEARVAIDPANREVFVGEARTVRVFDPGGMQVFEFQIANNLGAIRDLVVLPDGSLVTLAYDLEAPGDKPRFVLSHLDYRGVPVGEIELSGLPPEVSWLLPNRMVRWGDHIILASTLQLLAAELTPDGTVTRSWDLAKILGIPEEDRGNVEITGFNVDADGSLLATIAVQFRAYRIGADGQVAIWGKPGSAQGMFGVAGGIASDGKGRYFVADKARKVVMVFDSNFRFISEFGGDPSQPGRLGRPSEVFADGAGRLYVTQVGKAGVWSYDVRPEN